MIAQNNSNSSSGDDHVAVTTQPAPPASVPTAPERPALALGVELVGELQGSGYQERQWLVQRDGQFIQISELLYCVAEQINGERTLDEIAARVTEATEWAITAEQVRYIIQTKLIPIGLVAPAEGSYVPGARQAPSPLAVNVRTRVLGPGAIQPISKALQFLFAPLVLIPLLAIIVVAHAWLYFMHGVAGSVREAIDTPGLFLVALAMLLVSGVFHEFGHAAALRYGGGHVRGMGVGIYLIYPMFYTDTTDSYRLGRWARVRTGLGGIYFNLIFVVAIIALYLITGHEYLLLVVPLIDLEIIRQFMPFVRLDGYWVLSDLTGIPDFFTQAGAFLRSAIPLPGRKKRGSLNLKPWVKTVFALYLVIAIPILALLLFFLLAGVPTIAIAGWEAGLGQVHALGTASRGGNVVGIVAAAAQMLLLALQLVAIGYLLFSVLWRPAIALWRWSKPVPSRWAPAALTTLASLSLLTFLWMPSWPAIRAALASATAVPDGVEVFMVTDRAHLEGPLGYPQTPPVGGDHAPIWQNCGFYDSLIASEHAVHSMEHGAVWITYQSELPAEQRDVLRRLAQTQSHILVSPFQDLGAPVVASAWGRQLRLDSASDPRLEQFIRAFRLGAQAPERGSPCTGGVGQPAT